MGCQGKNSRDLREGLAIFTNEIDELARLSRMHMDAMFNAGLPKEENLDEIFSHIDGDDFIFDDF